MNRVILQRLESTDQGTFGKIKTETAEFYTLELPWRDNESNISCIPEGIYQCKMTMSYRFKKMMYLVDGTGKRTGIRIHSANLAGSIEDGYKAQLNGCIAIGEKLGLIGNQKALLLSSSGVRKFIELMNKKPFTLEVKNGMA